MADKINSHKNAHYVVVGVQNETCSDESHNKKRARNSDSATLNKCCDNVSHWKFAIEPGLHISHIFCLSIGTRDSLCTHDGHGVSFQTTYPSETDDILLNLKH